MGQEERKNKAKLEKTQINLATSNSEYENAVKILEETTGRWNRDWKAAADKFQDLEEERLDFMKSSLWSFANIASTVCVSDDASCEKVRLSLENCEVEKDIMAFIKEQGTGQEIPDPPKYINFCRGDVTDTQSEASIDDDAYSVAQFQRTINPAFRSSSPQPSTFESHHDPNSALARELGHGASEQSSNREAAIAPQKALADRTRNMQQEAARLQYEQSKHGPVSAVPHDPYPMDGMTMLCRPGPPSEMSSGQSVGARPSSRDSNSEYSNPTSFSSQDLASGKTSPIKQDVVLSPISEKSVAKKKSGFFNSPFRRKKSVHEIQNPMASSTPTNRNTWGPSARSTPQNQSTPSRYGGQNNLITSARSASPEPVDPRASFQLNVGNNVFDVATPDRRPKTTHNSPAQAQAQEDLDPIAQALAELKGVTKQSSPRVGADMYHGIATPAPGAQRSQTVPTPMANGALMAGMRGTPPPSYDQPISRLGAPQPAFTSKAMQASTQKYVAQTRDVFASPQAQNRPVSRNGGGYGSQPRPVSRNGAGYGSQPRPVARTNGSDIPRATSPLPHRSVSPRPAIDQRGGYRAPSPNPYASGQGQPQQRPSQQYTPTRPEQQSYSRQVSPNDIRSASPNPYRSERPVSSHINSMNSDMSMSMQLAQPDDGYGSQRSRTGGNNMISAGSRPQSSYGQSGPLQPRQRSKSVAAPGGGQFTRDGRPILHFGEFF